MSDTGGSIFDKYNRTRDKNRHRYAKSTPDVGTLDWCGRVEQIKTKKLFQCPFCAQTNSDEVFLAVHMDTAHKQLVEKVLHLHNLE